MYACMYTRASSVYERGSRQKMARREEGGVSHVSQRAVLTTGKEPCDIPVILNLPHTVPAALCSAWGP